MLLFDQNVIGAVLRIAVALGIVFGICVYIMVWAERKVCAAIQDRIGPNRVGPFGIFQGLADAVKFLFKEELRPRDAQAFLYYLAPFAAVFPALLVLAAVPFGAARLGGEIVPLQIADINVGILFVLSISSLSVYAVILAGLSAGSKYPLFGGLRAAAQVISYEIPLGLAIVSVVILSGSAKLGDIVSAQAGSLWFIIPNFLGFLLFMISGFAETNRLPFDLPEGETEIIGFHAEYSAMKFAMFFMAEYANMVVISSLIVLLFLGGWEFLPFVGWDQVSTWVGFDLLSHPILWIVTTLWFGLKVSFFLFLFIWVRWTLPRFRYDQLMTLGWKRLIPLSVGNLILVVLIAWRMAL